jgi:hypothetical protein
MQKLLVALVVVGAVSFSPGQSAQESKFLPIVFDDWWNIDYVKNGCEMAANAAKRGNPYAKPCPVDKTPAGIVKDFEDALEVAFASESACHGLSLLHFTPEMANATVKNPNAPASGTMARMAGDNWWLMLDLDGHNHSQAGRGWTLLGPAHHLLSGRITTPQRIVQQICKIAKGVGGKTEK